MSNGKYSAGTTVAIAGVFVGCCLNAVFLEYLVKADPASGTLATFSQYVFIAVEGFIFTHKFGTEKRNIPIKGYLTIVAVFFTCNVLNNYVFDFNISMPLHIIFRSGSLITNMVMGIIMLQRRYSFMKFFSVGLITLGVIICTLVTGTTMKSGSESNITVEDSYFWWSIGICILVLALFASSLLGIYQELMFRTYGKHPREALYYTHLLPFPAFLFFTTNIVEHFNMALKSPVFVMPIIGLEIPETLFYLIFNVLTQYLCIRSVYKMTTEASSLSVNLVLTLRKFISLILSILYFNNDFTFYHWIGTMCVFIGTGLFTELPQNLVAAQQSKKKTS